MSLTFSSTILCLFICLGCCGNLPAARMEPDVTPETRALFERLNTLRPDYLLFGHQHTTEYGIGWKAVDTEDSDVKRTTGEFPSMYGWDFFDPKSTTQERGGTSMHAHILAAHNRGGINTICWHAPNPVTGGSFYDTTAAVPALLPGGEKHEAFKNDLDTIATFLHDLRDPSGTLIPIIFRPWHEHNGNWFWWGTPHHCTPDEFATLWCFTVDYLRKEKEAHNLLFAWSPNWSLKDEYFLGYPGDAYVDIFGYDLYVPSLALFLPALRKLVERAEERGKIPALTEIGYPNGLSKCTREKPFTEDLLVPLRDDPTAKRVAWILLWRNGSEDHLWVPPPEHVYAEDFRTFYADSFTLFGDVLHIQ